jgi:PKD repeat protein
MRFLINGTSVANHTSDIPKTAMATEMSAQVVGANMTGDWLFIKRYEDPEPTHSIWESETVENAPNARFDAEPQWGYIPTTVYFSDTSTGVVSSWAWDLNGDGVVDNTTQSCSYTYTTSGSYTVELDVTNINGTSTETKTDLINIMDVPTPTPTSTPCPTGTTCPECNTTADDLVGGVGFGVVLVISVIVLTLVVGVALKMYSSVFK